MILSDYLAGYNMGAWPVLNIVLSCSLFWNQVLCLRDTGCLISVSLIPTGIGICYLQNLECKSLVATVYCLSIEVFMTLKS
jgi:hypothetical protein